MLVRSRRPIALIAEDDPDFREAVASVLSRQGIDVVLASTGREAVLRALEKKPDVVLLDHCMPEMGGLEALRQLRTRGYDGAVIHMSGFEEIELAAPDEYGHYVLDKPFGAKSLVFAVRRALSRSRRPARAQA
jgi:DNA-binding response OmpR family regulator